MKYIRGCRFMHDIVMLYSSIVHACHRFQLASMQAAEGVKEIKGLFGMMANIFGSFSTIHLKGRKA